MTQSPGEPNAGQSFEVNASDRTCYIFVNFFSPFLHKFIVECILTAKKIV